MNNAFKDNNEIMIYLKTSDYINFFYDDDN